MAERNELSGALGGNYAREPRRLQRISFGRAMLAHGSDSCGRHHDARRSQRAPCSDRLVASINHSGAALFVDVRKLTHLKIELTAEAAEVCAEDAESS